MRRFQRDIVQRYAALRLSYGVKPNMSVSRSVEGRHFGMAASPAVLQETRFAFVIGMSVFAAVLWLPGVLGDADTFWHITTGQWILAHREVPTHDLFSFTAAGRPWVAQEWLSEVLLALAYSWRGWNGVMILTAAAAGCSVGFVAFYVRRHLRLDVSIALVSLAVGSGGASLLARPHLVALPLVSIWTIGLVAARAHRTSPPLLLLPMMTVWANLHGGFILGLALTGALAVEAIADPTCIRREAVRSWGIFLLGAIVAGMITPHGIDGLLFPFRLLSMKDLDRIQEWQPSDLSHLNGVSGSILLALYLGLTGALQLPKFRVFLLAGLVFVTMQHARYMQLFGIIAPLLVAGSLASAGRLEMPVKLVIPQWIPIGLAGMAAALSLAFRSELPVELKDLSRYPSAALASVPADLRAKPVLNEYYFGGVLIFDGIRPFIDGRADLYGDDFLDTYLAIAAAKGNALDEVLCRYEIEWTIFSPDSVVPALIDRTPGWHRLYSDKIAVIQVRDQTAERPTCPPGRRLARFPAA